MAASEAAHSVVRTLFVTLRRSPIGAPHFHKSVLKALGLSKRHDCVERSNTASVRGALRKVAHLVRIETDAMFRSRRTAEFEATRLRPPIVVKHHQGGGGSEAASSSSSSAAAAASFAVGGIGSGAKSARVRSASPSSLRR